MFSTDTPAEQYLAARARLGIKFGLETMHALLGKLGRPDRTFDAVTVAGTNGKGSVAAYVDSALRASGLSAGRYTSPHLVRVHERITAAGQPIEPADLEHAVGEVRRAADELVAVGVLRDHPTYFEAVTAAALVHFARERVRAAVLEVGLGGRLDATNACDPVASAIVSVDFDHQELLGETLGAIANEKAGVLRAGRTTVVGPMAPDAREAIEREAQRVGARLVIATDGVRVTERGDLLDVATPAATYGAVRPLPGAHQRANVLVALRLLECAREAGVPVDLGAASEAIAATRWPGRLQHVPGDPPLLLDGAHNAAGARALADYLDGRGDVVLLFGAMADKDVTAMAQALFPLARAVVLTRVDMERAASPDELARRARVRGTRIVQQPDIGEALEGARALARPDATVVVAGSLYLVGAVLGRLALEGTVRIP